MGIEEVINHIGQYVEAGAGAYAIYTLMSRAQTKRAYYPLKKIKDEIGLIPKMIDIASRVRMDDEIDGIPREYKKSSSSFTFKTFRFLSRLPSHVYRRVKSFIIYTEPNSVRVYLNHQQNGKQPIRIELVYDEGIKSGLMDIESSKKPNLLETAHNIKLKGIPINVFA